MNDIIVVKPEKCVGCNACVRSCPAPEAFAGGIAYNSSDRYKLFALAEFHLGFQSA
jgi:Fe-S-cluster-containing hydrogenase component 2